MVFAKKNKLLVFAAFFSLQVQHSFALPSIEMGSALVSLFSGVLYARRELKRNPHDHRQHSSTLAFVYETSKLINNLTVIVNRSSNYNAHKDLLAYHMTWFFISSLKTLGNYSSLEFNILESELERQEFELAHKIAQAKADNAAPEVIAELEALLPSKYPELQPDNHFINEFYNQMSGVILPLAEGLSACGLAALHDSGANSVNQQRILASIGSLVRTIRCLDTAHKNDRLKKQLFTLVVAHVFLTFYHAIKTTPTSIPAPATA